MKKNYKIVRFDMYCKNCKHEKKSEEESPCDECLAIGYNAYSKRPVYYKKK